MNASFTGGGNHVTYSGKHSRNYPFTNDVKWIIVCKHGTPLKNYNDVDYSLYRFIKFLSMLRLCSEKFLE